jgi:hypothetical protein
MQLQTELFDRDSGLQGGQSINKMARTASTSDEIEQQLAVCQQRVALLEEMLCQLRSKGCVFCFAACSHYRQQAHCSFAMILSEVIADVSGEFVWQWPSDGTVYLLRCSHNIADMSLCTATFLPNF